MVMFPTLLSVALSRSARLAKLIKYGDPTKPSRCFSSNLERLTLFDKMNLPAKSQSRHIRMRCWRSKSIRCATDSGATVQEIPRIRFGIAQGCKRDCASSLASITHCGPRNRGAMRPRLLPSFRNRQSTRLVVCTSRVEIERAWLRVHGTSRAPRHPRQWRGVRHNYRKHQNPPRVSLSSISKRSHINWAPPTTTGPSCLPASGFSRR